MESKEYVLNKLKDIGLKAAEALQNEAPDLDGTTIIDREDDIPEFNPDKHQYLNWGVGTCVRDKEQVWKLIQPYDSNVYKDHPSQMRAQWGLCHTKNPLKAKPYVEPEGTSGMYMKDECCIKGGKVYCSKVDKNAWPPDEYPDCWKEYVE